MKKYLTPVLFTIIIIAVLFFAIRALISGGNDAKPEDTASPTPKALTEDQKNQLKEGQKFGNENATIVLTEFGDFQCPACKQYESTVDELRQKYPDKMLIVWKHFPLFPQPHKNARNAAYASESAANQGKFWDMHDMLYGKQDDWAEQADPKDKFVGYARELNLDIDKFSKDYDGQAGKANIDRDLALGKEIKLSGTPSFFINGQAYETTDGPAGLKAKIEGLLNGSGQ